MIVAIIIVILLIILAPSIKLLIGGVKEKKEERKEDREIHERVEKQFKDAEKIYGPTDPYERSKEWFLSEEGKKSLEYHINLYNKPVVQDKLLRKLKGEDLSGFPSYMDAKINRQTCPYSFLYYYIKAFDYDLLNYILTHAHSLSEEGFFYLITDSFANRYEEFNYEEIISFEKNYALKFLKRFRFFEPDDKSKAKYLMDKVYRYGYFLLLDYIVSAYEEGIDASEEKWIYDRENYIQSDGYPYDEKDIAYVIMVNAKFKELLTNNIKNLSEGSYHKDEIENRALLAN